MEVIVEEFIKFDYEITLLTLTQENGKRCIVHQLVIGKKEEIIKKVGSLKYEKRILFEACQMANKITKSLVDNGIWGVEFFISNNKSFFQNFLQDHTIQAW